MHLVSALSEAGMLQRHGLSPRRRSTPLAGSSVAVERSCCARNWWDPSVESFADTAVVPRPFNLSIDLSSSGSCCAVIWFA